MKTDRTLLLASFLAIVLVTATTGARAEETPRLDAEVALAALDAATLPGADTTWRQRWNAYRDAKGALAELSKDDSLHARYVELQPQVGVALRREAIPQSGVLMGVLGALLLWGGFFFCLGVAMKRNRGARKPPEGDETWPLRPE